MPEISGFTQGRRYESWYGYRSPRRTSGTSVPRRGPSPRCSRTASGFSSFDVLAFALLELSGSLRCIRVGHFGMNHDDKLNSRPPQASKFRRSSFRPTLTSSRPRTESLPPRIGSEGKIAILGASPQAASCERLATPRNNGDALNRTLRNKKDASASV